MAHFLYALTSSNIDLFSNLRLKYVATLPCEISVSLKATFENKTTSVTTYFKKLTTRNNVFIVSVVI